MAIRCVKGTFEADGSSDPMRVFATRDVQYIALSLVIPDGQVDLERRVDGANWRVVESYTANAESVISIVDTESYRLTRSGHVSNVDYFLGYAERG